MVVSYNEIVLKYGNRESEKMKKQKIKIKVGFIFWLLLSVALFLGGLFQWNQWNEKGEDLNQVSLDDSCPGKMVEGKIMANYGTFAEEYETTLSFRTSDDSEKLYYIIPIGESGKFIAFMTTGENYDAMSQLMIDTLDYNAGKISTIKGVEVRGKLHQMSNSTMSYMVSYFQETNLLGTDKEEEIKDYISPYVLEYHNNRMAIPAMAVAGCIFFVDILSLWIKPFNMKKRKIEDEEIQEEEEYEEIHPEEAFKEVMRRKKEEDEETLKQIELYLGPLEPDETKDNTKSKTQNKKEVKEVKEVKEAKENHPPVSNKKKKKKRQVEQIKIKNLDNEEKKQEGNQ